MHTRLKQGSYWITEANDALFTFVTSFVYIMKLSHLAVELKFLKKQFPVVATSIFNRVLCSFIAIEVLDVND